MRTLLRMLGALAIANGIAVAIVWACGPDYTALQTIAVLSPADSIGFDRGEIGIIRPRFRRATLAMSYRVLNNRSPLDVTYDAPSSSSRSGEFEWQRIREGVLGPNPDAPERTRRMRDYVVPINCLEDAYTTAVRTFADRQQRFGANSVALRNWVQAQATVFANCNEEPFVLPAPPAATADALTKADRAYQTAAAYFYAMQYDESARRFRAIADDASSPWRPYGRYLAARSTIRIATMAIRPEQRPEALAAAEKELLAVLSDPVAAPVHNSARGLLRFVRLRLKPYDELRMMSARLSSAADTMPWSEIEDVAYVLDRAVGDTVSFDYSDVPVIDRLRGSHDLIDWIVALQGYGTAARDRAIARWEQTGSVPWLVAALSQLGEPSQLRPPYESVDALLFAAAAVPSSSPAFPTVAFFRVRLLIALGRLDAARQVLAALPNTEGPGASSETINLYRGERLMVASTLEELLASAPRNIEATVTATGERVPLIAFDEDAGVVLSERLPLDRLIAAGLSSTLPARLRTRVAIAAFTRAILLNRHDRARQIGPTLRSLAPVLVADIDRYMRETTPAGRKRAAVLLILRTPGMTKDVRGLDDMYSMQVVAPHREFESFVSTWWCGPVPGSTKRVAGTASSELIHTLYPDHVVPYPSFISTAERSAVEQELAALDSAGHATKFLATAALEWARERPRDPEAAEALSHIVVLWRRACRDAEDFELSRQSFQTLHRQFGNSEWAKRTPYWYR